jgi:hypothetical protein
VIDLGIGIMTTKELKIEETIESVIDIPIRIPKPRKVIFPLFNIGDKCPVCGKIARDLMVHAKEQMDPEHIIYVVNNS